jgi:hypothetical protein
MEPHTKECSLCERDAFKGESTTVYLPKDLALIQELQEAFSTNMRVSKQTITAILDKYIHEALCKTKLSAVRKCMSR